MFVGTYDGIIVGNSVKYVGNDVGIDDGATDGEADGVVDGNAVSDSVKYVGNDVGIEDGATDGEADGVADGNAVVDEAAGGPGSVIVDPLSKDTAAIAKPRPTTVDDEPYVIDTLARIVPTKLLDAPIVALVPSAQYTFDARAPFSRMKDVEVDVVSVVAVWNIH